MASRSGSALSPSPATRPLTVTKPCSMSSSALRREAMPARARIFCSLSSIAFLIGFRGIGGLGSLFELRHLAQEDLFAVVLLALLRGRRKGLQRRRARLRSALTANRAEGL